MFLGGWHLLMRGGPVMAPLLLCALLSLTLMLERAWALSRVDRETAAAPGAGPLAGRLREAVLRRRASLARSLHVLDTIITVAPLLGLLGTVTGMIGAFHVLDRSGLLEQPGTARITGGVAEALIATAAGLGIAIVTLVGYNALSARAASLRAAAELSALHGLNCSGEPGPSARLPRAAPFKKARIEIIPMIDTIFFLLVFFMLTSLQTVQMSAKKVRLPLSRTARLRPEHNVVVTLTRDGEYYVNYRRVSELQIRPLVAAWVDRDPQTVVVLNCDREQSVERMTRILDLTKQANAARVVLATAPPESLEAPHGTP